MISLSMRLLTATLAIGVTVPSASICTGIDFLHRGRDLDRTTAARPLACGACATAPIGPIA